MNSRAKTLLASIVVAVLLFCVGWARNEQAKKITWEYKYLVLSSSQGSEYAEKLNQQGTEGWELAAVDREQPGGLVHFYFKRAR